MEEVCIIYHSYFDCDDLEVKDIISVHKTEEGARKKALALSEKIREQKGLKLKRTYDINSYDPSVVHYYKDGENIEEGIIWEHEFRGYESLYIQKVKIEE